jgi:hypothetical protein
MTIIAIIGGLITAAMLIFWTIGLMALGHFARMNKREDDGNA